MTTDDAITDDLACRGFAVRITGRIAVAALLAAAVAGGCSKNPEKQAQKYIEHGDTYAAKQQYKEAIIEYRNAVQVNPRSGDARLKLAETYSKTQDVKNAFREYVRAADLLPGNTDAQLKAGDVLLLSGRYEDARGLAQKLLARDPKNVRGQILLGNATAGMKDLDGAVADMEEAIRLEPGRAGTYANLGMLELARGKKDAAGEAFRKAVETDSKSIEARLALANFYMTTSQQGLAETTLRDALSLEPKNLLANRAMALLAIRSGHPADAAPYLQAVAASSQDESAKLWVADTYIAMGRLDDAAPLLESLTASGTGFVKAKVRLAGIAAMRGDRSRAHQLVDEALARDAKAASALEIKARLLLADRKPDEAAAKAKAAVASEPQSASAQYTLGLALVAQNQLDEAQNAFQEVLKLNPRAQSAQFQLSRLHLAVGQPEQSAQYAQDILKSQPANPGARLMLVRSLVARRDAAGAEREIAPLLATYPNVSSVHAAVGTVSVLKHDAVGARRAFGRALELDAENVEALRGLTMLDIMEKKTVEARQRVDGLVSKNPSSGPALLLAGETYARTGDLGRAEGYLKSAIAANPNSLPAYGMLGQLYVAQHKLEAARAEYQDIVARRPKSVETHTMLGILYDMDHRPADAEKSYQAALAIDARAGVAANNLAWRYADDNRNLDEALQLAQAAKAALAEEPNVSDTLGWVYYRKGMFSQALEALQQSALADPKNPLVHYHLGMAYVRLNDLEHGRQSLREALRLDPKMNEAGEVEKTLKLIGG